MEDSSDSLSDLFKKPDSIRIVQSQSRVSESPVSSNSKENVLNASDNDSVLSAIFRKPKKLMVSSTNSVFLERTPNLLTADPNIDAEDTVVCKKKKFNFNVLQSNDCSNIFGNTPNTLCESIAKVPRRKKKCLKNADADLTSLSVQFSGCDTTESSIVLPKKQFAERSTADRRSRSKALSLFKKREPSFLSPAFPPAHNLSVNTSNGLESSVVFSKRKSTLKRSERFCTSDLFVSEPSSDGESFIEKRKTKRFRNDSTHQQFSPKDLPECSNVEDENEDKLTRKPLASFADKENRDLNFDNTVSSVSDSIVLKKGGGILSTLNKTKYCTANTSVTFGHSEGLSDVNESNSESEKSEKDPTSNDTCEDESSSCREPESTNRSASILEGETSSERESINRSASLDEDETRTCHEEPESTQKNTSSDQEESIVNEDYTIQASQGDLSTTICRDRNSIPGGNRSLLKSTGFKEVSTILADLSATELSKATIQPTLLEPDQNQAPEIEHVSPKFVVEVNESSIDKFVLSLEMSEQQKSVESSALEKANVDIDPARSIENIQMSLVEAVSVNTENPQPSFRQYSFAEPLSTNLEDIRMSITGVTLENGNAELVTSEMKTHTDSLRASNAEKSSDSMNLCEWMETKLNRMRLLETRKKRRASALLMEVDNGECENRDSPMKADQIVETEMNVSKGECSSGNRSKNLLGDTILPSNSPPAKSNILNADWVGGDDLEFSLAMKPDSELSLSDVTPSRLSSVCHSSKIDKMANRINDETRVLHSTTVASSVPGNCSANVQNNTYTVLDPIIVKDDARMSQTLSAIFQCPRVFALSQNESDSVSTSQESTNVDTEKNRTYTVQKTITDETSVLLTKKKVTFPELPVEDDPHMFSVNSNLLSETVAVERRVTRSSARLSTLSAMLDESVPSQPRNSRGSRSGSRVNVSVTCSGEKAENSMPVNESLSKENELAAPEVPQIEESAGEGVSAAVNKSLAEETSKSVLENSKQFEESKDAKTSRLSEKSESEKSELTRESASEDVSRPMDESEDEEESEQDAESEEEAESEQEAESEKEDDSELEEESKEEESEGEKESEQKEESEQEEETESANFRNADESSDTSTLFRRPESVHLIRSRSRNVSMSLSSSRKKSVSFAQPVDSTQFASSSGSRTQTLNSSVSLVCKMCQDKSTVRGARAGKRLPPKRIRKMLRSLFDSDDDEPANDSIDALPKKPDFPKFHPWCGKQFYGRIIEKMRPKYGVRTNLEAVRLAEYVWQTVRQVESCRDADVNHEKVEEMKRVLARKQIVTTHYEFYIFCVQNLPQTFHLRALPMGPYFPSKFDLAKTFDPILADS